MGWLTGVTGDCTVEQNRKYLVERQYRIFGGQADEYTRTRTVVTTHYIGLTQAAAANYATAHKDDSGVVDSHSERDGQGGAWRVVIVTDTTGAWTLVE